ncbi:MAG: tRNA threonylcarbamoyladenosine dehydratase [Prolixibacteraceae bacterium]|jgi:tRNA threonylcarbamoyladenosine dehydratase|nr:tRNA threonylcarbamoyladenosine dehydratase [Prolixibacteraceae bacterium]MBT6006905.1 tRNA threonylcarbamoyladenosine dehydratase [Prolixibacteraceae bacterium]MBT6766012.1 tRNA threonylcarbamoyladenosine dehydratase [Prolixibacteraceae bacterium]MBT6998410.1 tRNA threonylcarbamoyladenosine dehydratase [Prolixibacteraceae bacterium]MBT7396747.1 tRNA threonylcarbamoyladenosine dehydratase [Prolixibacteraceae bacterium]
MDWLVRTELLLGEEKLNRLKKSNILVVGLGGVGAYAAEQLCRSGVGKMTIVDSDVVENSNRNRQLSALISTMNKPKADVLAQRFLDINPELKLIVVKDYIHDEEILELLKSQPFDYVVDAIDTLTPKIFLIQHALQLELKVVSSMGAGGKLDPSCIRVSDISKSYNCKLARMLRKRLGKFDIKTGVQVVFSTEKVNEKAVRLEEGQNKKSTVGTISYMPAIFGCFLSSVVIQDLIQIKLKN